MRSTVSPFAGARIAASGGHGLDHGQPFICAPTAPHKRKQSSTPEVTPLDTPMEVLKEYAVGTTLHGVRYIARERAAPADRLCWGLAVVLCIVCALIFVLYAWDSFKNSPTVTSVENTHYPLYAFPFPAVTVCPTNRVRRNVGYNILRRYIEENLSPREIANLSSVLKYGIDGAILDLMSTFSFYYHPQLYRMGEYLQYLAPIIPHLKNFSISEFMLQVLPPCKAIFYQCFWHGFIIDCCSEFHLQRTESGFCYSFNSLSSDNASHCSPGVGLSLGSGQQSPEDQRDANCRLRRNTASGSTSGLELFFHYQNDHDQLESGRQRDRKGFRVLIHHPNNLPEGGKDMYVRALEPEEIPVVFSLKVSPQATVSTNSLKSLSPSERACFFADEHRLEIFHTYTLTNCMIQCRQRYLADLCKCRTYYFENLGGNYPECEMSQLKCLMDNNEFLRFLRSPEDKSQIIKDRRPLDCSYCLPTCHDMLYNVDATVSEDSNPVLKNSSAYFDIYYKDFGAVKYRKDVAFGIMQLLVSFGGIMSLFLGVSILSLVELVYYLLRLLLALARRLINSSEQRRDTHAPSVHPWNNSHTVDPRDIFRREGNLLFEKKNKKRFF